MKYQVEVNGQLRTVELEERGGQVVAEVEGRRYELRIERPEDAVLTMFLGTKIYEAAIWPADPGLKDATFSVKLSGRVFRAQIRDRRHRRAAAEQHASGQQILTAPMPGKIVKVLLSAGDPVAAGQGVVVVEAMKMQNEVKSTRAGRIIEIRVQEGTAVNANQVLAIVE